MYIFFPPTAIAKYAGLGGIKKIKPECYRLLQNSTAYLTYDDRCRAGKAWSWVGKNDLFNVFFNFSHVFGVL